MSTILIVDDDESIRELLRLHLSSAGYEVSVAEDAIVAGYMVLRRPPDPSSWTSTCRTWTASSSWRR